MPDSASAPPSEGLRVLRSAELTRRQLDQVVGVYEQAFPPPLRVPFADLASPSPADLMLVAVDRGEPVGLAANMLLGQSGWTFLRYYGISASRQRQGIGLRFWRLLLPALTAAGCPTQIVFEVEDPRHAARDTAAERVRRVRVIQLAAAAPVVSRAGLRAARGRPGVRREGWQSGPAAW